MKKEDGQTLGVEEHARPPMVWEDVEKLAGEMACSVRAAFTRLFGERTRLERLLEWSKDMLEASRRRAAVLEQKCRDLEVQNASLLSRLSAGDGGGVMRGMLRRLFEWSDEKEVTPERVQDAVQFLHRRHVELEKLELGIRVALALPLRPSGSTEAVPVDDLILSIRRAVEALRKETWRLQDELTKIHKSAGLHDDLAKALREEPGTKTWVQMRCHVESLRALHDQIARLFECPDATIDGVYGLVQMLKKKHERLRGELSVIVANRKANEAATSHLDEILKESR